jgi:hypothetical protein
MSDTPTFARWDRSGPFASHCITCAEATARAEAAEAENTRLREALNAIIATTHSHIDGRDLLAELHPRNALDIKRRVDGRETWFQADWLSDLWTAIKTAQALGGEHE